MVKFDKKVLKSYLKLFMLSLVAFYLINRYLTEVTYFWFGVVLSILNAKKMKGFVFV